MKINLETTNPESNEAKFKADMLESIDTVCSENKVSIMNLVMNS